jgi:hypothetical protein
MNIFYLLSCADPPMEMALIPEPGAVNILHAFYSEDLIEWEHQGPIAYGVSSLGLAVVEDGLRLTLIQEVRPPTWWEFHFKSVIYGYLFDGTDYTPQEWSVSDPSATAYIDPQYFESEFWYISPPIGTIDPAISDSPIALRNTGKATVQYSAPRLADPSPVRFNSELYVFATQNGSIVQLTGSPLKAVEKNPIDNGLFNGTNVPFATVFDNNLYLFAQRNVNGRHLPVYSVSTDAKSWTDWTYITPIPPELKSCTSPVVGPNPSGGYVLFCIDERPPPMGFKP